MTIHMSKFALLCQAARLLGQVLHHVSVDSGMDDGVCIQLERTLQSMLAAALNVDSPDNDQISFIYRSVSSEWHITLLTLGTVLYSLCTYLRLVLMHTSEIYPPLSVQMLRYST
jgi:hypothetical protein